MEAPCLLAAEGTWTQVSVFDDVCRLVSKMSNLPPFLNKYIFQEGKHRKGRYSFTHLSVQQFLATMFYVLESNVALRWG